MNPQIPTFEELEQRIQADIDYFQGEVPERYAIAWRGYLAGLLEWGLISIPDHTDLFEKLPKISDPDPVNDILDGREYAGRE